MEQREIKFRGIDKVSKDIVYGDLIHGVGAKAGKVYILPKRMNLAYVKNCDPLDGVEVLPETVGQFTGLVDKNKVDIYEGDIVEFDKREWGDNDNIHVVSWDGVSGAWSWGGGVTSDMEWRTVIGNIHQRPELLNN